MSEPKTQTKEYTEFRADGWPLCPVCGEDELAATQAWPNSREKRETLQAMTKDELRVYYVDRIDGCLNCGWKP